MIYLTGDTHGNFDRLHSLSHLTKDDILIVCGDFGIWNSKWVIDSINDLGELPFLIAFIDGNHENFDMIYKYPIESWNKGIVRRVSSNVIHLERGQVYEIDSYKILTLGGARSIDIRDGILDMNDSDFSKKYLEYIEKKKEFRVKDIDWWEAEMPTEEQLHMTFHNLVRYGHEVDYIITHSLPSRIQYKLPIKDIQSNELTDYLDLIDFKTKFKKWFSGHYHLDMEIDNRFRVLYNDIIPIEISDNYYNDIDNNINKEKLNFRSTKI